MFLDDRLLGADASTSTRDQWAEEKWPKVQLLWAFMILLNIFAPHILPIEPLVLHVLAVLLKLMPDPATPVIQDCDEAHDFQV